MEKHKCSEPVYNKISWHDCPNKAKININSKWYCGIHDPVKRAKKEANWKKLYKRQK